MIVKDEAGHETESFATFTKKIGTAIINPTLTLTNPDSIANPISVIAENPYEVLYTGDGTGGAAELYVDGILVDSDDSDGLMLDIINGDYDEGEGHYLYVKADDSGTIKYSAKSYNTVAQDLFDDTSMLETLDANAEAESGKLTLKQTGGVYATNTNTAIQSNAVFGALVENAYVDSVIFEANDNIPTGTSISYEISNNGTDFVSVADGQTIDFTTVGTEIVVKATLNTTDSSVSPEILDWSINVAQVDRGAEFVIKLIDEPINVNAEPQVNYKTLIKWEDSVNPEGTKYNVYRVDCDTYDEDFDIEDGTLIGENVGNTFFYDYNLNFDKTYSYKVTAVANVGTTEEPIYREGVLSEYATASTIDSDEFYKRLGLQDYWRYTGFVTGSGSGQIELSQGNLSYQTTDFVFPGPMFAMAMRRTYNSQSTSKTALGYGTDFSFNTTLMVEYDEYETEVGVILKDGDGTIHRFTKNGSVYESPVGVFMELTYDAQNEQWIISKIDGISYIFDNNMMMYRLQDRNGNYLEYVYDEEGNIDTITDNAGNYITFTYNEYRLIDAITVAGPDPMDNNDERVYKYSYITDATGKVRLARRELEGETYFIEKFEYDQNTGELENIIDGENHSYTVYYTAGEDKVSRVEYPVDDPITESFEISYGTNTTTVSFKGNNTVYAYDTNGCVTGITNALGYTTTYGYDETSWQIDEVEYYNKVGDSTTDVAITTAVVYDGHDNISIVTDDQGNTIEYDYIDPTTQSYSLFDMPYSVTVTSEDETESITTEYTYDMNGNVLTEKSANVVVSTNTYYSGAWSDETNMGYPGQLHTSTDRYGSVITYEYTIEGWLYRVYDDNDNYTEYEYDGMGNPIYITDAEGHITKTDYDLIGRKIKVYYPDGDNDFADGTNDTEWWVYNNNNNVTHHYVGTGSEEVLTGYKYDDMNGMVKKYHNSNIYPEMTVNYNYYEVETGKYAQKVSYTDKEGIESAEYYDSIGRLIETKMISGASYTNRVSYEYDKAGNMVKVTDGEGRITEAQYDELNRKVSTIVEPEESIITLDGTDDYIGLPGQVFHFTGNYMIEAEFCLDEVDGYYALWSKVDPNSNGGAAPRGWAFMVDSGDKLRFWYAAVQDAATIVGGSTVLSANVTYKVRQYYDGTTLKIDLSSNGGETWNTEISITSSTAINLVATDTGYPVNLGRSRWQSHYSDFFSGDIIDLKVIDGQSNPSSTPTSHYHFENEGTNTQVIDQNSLYNGQAYNGAVQHQIIEEVMYQYAYDYLGRIIEEIDCEGAITKYTYDDFNRLKTVTQSPDWSQQTPEEYVTTYSYDTVNGDYIVNQITDAEGGIKQTWFDNLGRVYKEVDDGTDDEDDLIIESIYHYDDIGRMTYKEFADGTILGYEYDTKGNLWKEKYFDSYTDYTADNYTDYTFYVDYDSRGNLKRTEGEVNGEDFYHEWAYDTRNRVTQQKEYVALESNTAQNIISYAYWENGQLKSVTYPATFADEYSAVSQKYYYNEYGQLSDIMMGSLDARSYIYDNSGKVIRTDTYIDLVDTGDVMSAYYTYDDIGMTTDIQYKLNGTLKERYQYAYDDNGMITSETINPYGLSTTISKNHTYDDIGRLTQTTINNTTYSYTYDDIGNRLSENDGTDSWVYEYNELFQLEQINKNSSKEFEYTYDAIGSQLTQKEYDTSATLIEEQTFTYHENGLLKNVLIDDSDGQDPDKNEYYQYNGQGQRIVKEFNDGTDTTMTRYMYTGSEVIMTANSAGLKTTENILTPSGQIVSSQRFNSNGNGTGWYSYNYDIRQSTTTIVNSAGTSMNSYLYDAFGETDATESLLNEVEFTGATSDSNIGLYYMNARYYNPNTGRFISQDSYKGSAYKPWTQNLYVYTGNNPVNYIDPTGHWFAPPELIDGDYWRSGPLRYNDPRVVPEPDPDGGADEDEVILLPPSEMEVFSKAQADEDGNIDEWFLALLEYDILYAQQVMGTENAFILPNNDDYNSWVSLVGDNKPLDIKHTIGFKLSEYQFMGVTVTAEDLGNIHYGYVGKGVGITKLILKYGSWSNNRKHKDDDNWEIYKENEKGDQKMIDWGISLYNERKRYR